MAFLHSLVRAEPKRKKGWWAPVELGDAAPHYVSFVLPLDEDGVFFREYTCETVTVKKDGSKKIDTHTLVRQGDDSFVLHLAARICGSPSEQSLPRIVVCRMSATSDTTTSRRCSSK